MVNKSRPDGIIVAFKQEDERVQLEVGLSIEEQGERIQ